MSNVIQLVTVKDDGVLEITTEGINFLSTLQNEKLGIISSCGNCKTGKSFLLNSILGQNVFDSSNSTKGIMIYNSVIEVDGIKMLVLDTQGLTKGNADLTGQKIFILSILLSTCLLFISEELNEDAINNFAYFSDVANKINVHPDSTPNAKILNNIDNLGKYFPELIWCYRKCSTDFDSLIESSPKTEKIKKLFLTKSGFCLGDIGNENSKNLPAQLMTKIKSTLKYKKINNYPIDGEALFGVLQNYLDSMNNDETPIISLSLENVLLSKAKNISEKNFEIFKSELTKQFENKYPLSYMEIYKQFFILQDKEIEKFCSDIGDTLTVKQAANYVIKINTRMRNELETIFDNNKEYYDEWFDIEYKEMEEQLPKGPIEKIEDIPDFFKTYTTSLQNGFNKFLDIPNSDFCRNLVAILIKIVQDHVIDKITKASTSINELFSTYNKESEKTIDSLNAQIKKLNEQLTSDKNLIEEKSKEKSDLNRQFLELETKYDKLAREMKAKEKEYANNLNIEEQKYQKIEMYYMKQVSDKEYQNSQLESKIEKLNKDLAEINKENSAKTKELSRENLKLQMEIERFKEQEKKGKSDLIDNKNLNLQSLFKNIQNTFMEFKESVDKLGRENESMLGNKYLELTLKEIETKLQNWMEWIEGIRSFCEDKIKTMNESYEKNIKKVKEEVEELNFELTQKAYSLNEQKHMTEIYIAKLKEANGELEDVKSISASKDELITTQSESIKLFEQQIEDFNKTKEDLEHNLNKNIINYKMKEDELDTLLMVVEGMLSKKRDKYDHNVSRLSNETKGIIEGLVKTYKLFK